MYQFLFDYILTIKSVERDSLVLEMFKSSRSRHSSGEKLIRNKFTLKSL